MKTKITATITLIILASVLPELITGSSPISKILNPLFFLLLFLSYGIPVLLVREISVRSKLSFMGIFILGIAFGIFNEGLGAKTLIKPDNLPIGQYDNYGYFLGISFPFTVIISFWHALSSVLIPILLVHRWFPKQSGNPWLNKKISIALGLLILIIGSLNLLGESIIKGSPVQLIVLLAIIIVLFFIAKRFKQNGLSNIPSSFNWGPVWLGMSLLVSYFIILTILAGTKLNLIIYFAVYALIILAYIQTLKKNRWLTSDHLILFGIGCYIQNILIGMVFSVFTPDTLAERLASGIIMLVIFMLFIRKITKSPNPYSAPFSTKQL